MSQTKRYAEEAIIAKVGGRFRLSVLIQKRLQELNRGQRAMVSVQAEDPMDVVLEEIAQDRLAFEAARPGRRRNICRRTGGPLARERRAGDRHKRDESKPPYCPHDTSSYTGSRRTLRGDEAGTLYPFAIIFGGHVFPSVASYKAAKVD